MKKYFNVKTILALLFLISFNACTDKDKEDESDPIFNAKYASTTAEEAKDDVEEAGIELINSIDELEDSEAIDVMMQFENIFGGNGESAAPASNFNIPLKVAQILSNDSKSTTEVFEILKSATATGMSLKDAFAQQTASYIYNFDTEQFDSIRNDHSIVFEFPGSEDAFVNNAAFVIDNFSVFTLTESHDKLPTEYIEAPKSLNAQLVYKNTLILSYQFNAAYMANGVPTNIFNKLTIGDFAFVEKFDHSDYKTGSFSFEFKKNDEVLIGFGAGIGGNWTQTNIENNTERNEYEYEYYNWQTGEYVGTGEYYTEESVYIENIIKTANAHIQIMNLKAVGEVNINKLIPEMQAVDYNNNNMDYSAVADKEVAIAKKYIKMVLVYADTETLIAALEPYKASNIDMDYTDYYLDFRLVFKDESRVSAETYVQNELSGFFTSLNSFITKMNVDYNANMETVDVTEQ